jgi:hypothetical protein
MSKAVNVIGTQDDSYAVYADLYYLDGSSERVTASFPTGNHDYVLEEEFFTPSKPIKNFTFVVTLGKDGTAYFTNLAFQEKVPGSENSRNFLLFLKMRQRVHMCVFYHSSSIPSGNNMKKTPANWHVQSRVFGTIPAYITVCDLSTPHCLG